MVGVMQFSVNASVSLQTLDLRTRFNLQVSFSFLEKHIHLVKLHCPLVIRNISTVTFIEGV